MYKRPMSFDAVYMIILKSCSPMRSIRELGSAKRPYDGREVKLLGKFHHGVISDKFIFEIVRDKVGALTEQ